MREVIEVEVVSAALRRLGAPVSPLVRFGDFLQTCGMPPIDLVTGGIVSGSIEEQTDASIKAIEWTLRHGGATLDDVLKTTLFITDAGLLPGANAVYARYFSGGFPARTAVVVQPWPADFCIEIECLALAGRTLRQSGERATNERS